MQKRGVSNHDRVMIKRLKATNKSQEEVSRALRIKLEIVKEFWDEEAVAKKAKAAIAAAAKKAPAAG